MDDEIAIKVDHVSKTFKLPHEKNNSIKSAVVNFYRRKRTFETQEVLNDISFEIKKGEFFGIVGRNGSGKSTLLKMLAGIYTQTKGNIQVNGKLTPFIELGVGFNPELTGRENVFLNGSLLGFSRKEMSAMYRDIVEFAELERFMDQKLKNYSSGMQVRLAFSIAIRARSDILLLDEVLAVGDAAFQRKCFDYFGNLKKNKQTVVFISHDMESVRKYCDRALFIEKGVIQEESTPDKVIKKFTRLFLDEITNSMTNNKDEANLPIGISATSKVDRTALTIKNVWLEDQNGLKAKVINDSDDDLIIKFEINALKSLPNFVPGVVVRNLQGESITASNAKWAKNAHPHKIKAGDKVIVTFKIPNVYERGDYTISVNAVSDDLASFYAWKNEPVSFYSDRTYETGAKVYPKFEVQYQNV